jgi:transmembrane sensor
MTGPPLSPHQLARLLADELPPEEAEAIRRWLLEHADQRVDVDAALRHVKTRARRRSPWRIVAYAAAAVVVLAAGALVVRQQRDASTSIVYSTGVGERAAVDLADGSSVLLGPASRVAVRDREVELTGEALFTVVHDPARPFTVRAGDAVIRDIGTEFSVHYDSAEPVRVVVREGVVELRHASDSVTLRPGDVGVVALGGRVEASRGTATAVDLAWTRGQLVFRNAPLTELVADLRRWYGVEFRVIDSSLLRRHFTGSFAGEPADRVLEVIGLALGARVERRGDTAFVSSTPSNK